MRAAALVQTTTYVYGLQHVISRMRVWCVAGHGQSRDDMGFLRSTAPEMDGLFDGFNSNCMVNTTAFSNNSTTGRLVTSICYLPFY
jgi:hypothetical protein